jgi:hypothetical protein
MEYTDFPKGIKMKRLSILMVAIIFLFATPISSIAAEDQGIFLVHLKTSLKKDDVL